MIKSVFSALLVVVGVALTQRFLLINENEISLGDSLALIALLVSIFAFLEARRAAKSRMPRVKVDSTSCGAQGLGASSFSVVTAFCFNLGDYNVSIASFYVEVYESRLLYLLSRLSWIVGFGGFPTRVVRGDGYFLYNENGRVKSGMRPSDGVPRTIEEGGSARFDVNDSSIWPDRNWRRVYFCARLAQGNTVRRQVRCQPHCILDDKGREDNAQNFMAALERQLNEN